MRKFAKNFGKLMVFQNEGNVGLCVPVCACMCLCVPVFCCALHCFALHCFATLCFALRCILRSILLGTASLCIALLCSALLCLALRSDKYQTFWRFPFRVKRGFGANERCDSFERACMSSEIFLNS